MLNSGSSENAPYETVWKIVRVASRPYVSPTGGGKTGRLALLDDLKVPVLGLFGISKQFLQAIR